MDRKAEDPRGIAAELYARIKRTGLDGQLLIEAVRTGKHHSRKMPRLKDSSKLLARIAALPFNEFLAGDVGQLRQKYNIPAKELDKEDQRVYLGLWADETDYSEDPNLRDEEEEEPVPQNWIFRFVPHPDAGYMWYLEQTKNCFDNSVAFYYNTLRDKSAYLPVDELTLAGFEIPYWRPAWVRRFKKCKMKNLLETRMPLEREIIEIVRRYHLPLFLVYNILDYTLSGRRCDLVSGLHLLPDVHANYNQLTGQDEITLAVPLHPWDNQGSWNSRWKNVRVILEDLRIRRGINEPSTKRASIRSYWKQVVRSAEWFNLSETQGLGPTKALEKWEELYPDQRGKYDQSTVTKAIKEFVINTSK